VWLTGKMDVLLIMLLATTGVLCDAAATEGEKALECGAGELLFEDSCWWDDCHGHYTWARAEDECKARNMSLASIHSEEEQAFVLAMTEGKNCYPSWIGLSDAAYDWHRDWQWSDGTPVDYLNWYQGDPCHVVAWECAYTSLSHSGGEWGCGPCDGEYGVVCRGHPY